MVKNAKKNDSKSDSSINYYLLIPIIIILTIIPLIVKIHIYDTHLSQFPWFSTDGSKVDFFLYYKSVFFIALSIIMLIILIYKYYTQKKIFKFTPTFIPLIVYATLVLLSSIFSKYKYFAIHGIFEQFESVFVILGYCLISYYTYLVINNESQIQKVIKWWMYGMTVLCIIGLTQFIGFDFFATNIGKKLITTPSFWSNLESITFSFDKHTVYSTLYNPNYVGLYAALTIPIMLCLSILSENFKSGLKYIIMALALLICMFGSGSRNGLICITISFVFMLLIFRNKILKHWKTLVAVITVIVISFIITNIVTNNLFINRLKEITNIKTTSHTLERIETNDDNVTITYNNEILNIVLNDVTTVDINNIFNFTDSSNNIINSTYDPDSKTFIINDERFQNINVKLVTIDDIYAFVVNIDSKDWVFTNEYNNEDTYYYYNRFGNYDKIANPKSAVFTNYESIAGRGYIWSRTIPLLKDYLLLGSGADTFTLVYPQNDYVGMYNNGFGDSIMSKPHNLYLQIGVQSGVLSLIAFITFYIMYFISSLRLYWKNDFKSYVSKIGVAIFIGSISYMISGLANDSSITVAPIFWILIGLGISINSKVKLDKNN